MAAGNHRRGIWLPPGAEVRAHDLHEVMTVREWLAKPLTPATRGEVAAFGEALVKNQVAHLVRYVVDGHEKMMTARCRQMIGQAIAAERAQRWWRRLGRWIATFGHQPVPQEPQTFKDFDAIDTIIGDAEAEAAAASAEQAPEAERL